MMASRAEELSSQADGLKQSVSFFKLRETSGRNERGGEEQRVRQSPPLAPKAFPPEPPPEDRGRRGVDLDMSDAKQHGDSLDEAFEKYSDETERY